MDEALVEKGRKVRREVLGDAYVERAAANTVPFNAPFGELVHEYCWGWLWNREGLPRATRSLVVITMLGVLNRGAEFKVHVAGALRNGCTVEQIQEVLLHVAVYAGMPAGSECFRLAREAIDDYSAAQTGS